MVHVTYVTAIKNVHRATQSCWCILRILRSYSFIHSFKSRIFIKHQRHTRHGSKRQASRGTNSRQRPPLARR